MDPLVARSIAQVANVALRGIANKARSYVEVRRLRLTLAAIERELGDLPSQAESALALLDETYRHQAVLFLRSADARAALEAVILNEWMGITTYRQSPAGRAVRAAIDLYIAPSVATNEAVESLAGCLRAIGQRCATQVKFGSGKESRLLSAEDRKRLRPLLERVEAYQSMDLGSTLTRDLVQVLRPFVEQVRQATERAYETIEAPNIPGSRRATVPLAEIFVDPEFQGRRNTSRIGMSDFLASFDRAVVLGRPGAGKTTLARAIAHSVAVEAPRSGDERVSIIVNARALRPQQSSSEQALLVNAVQARAVSLLQSSVPSEFAEWLAATDRLILAVDGLDEVADPVDRALIRDEIAAFCDRYPMATVLVTSRLNGYDEHALPAPFIEYEVGDFSTRQVESYVAKWFTLAGQSEEVPSNYASDFLEELRHVSGLVSTPLLLGLICVLYVHQHFIPRSRPEIYEACADLLFRYWDTKRGIPVPQMILTQNFGLRRKVLSDVALWLMEGEAGHVPAPDASVLANKVAESLESHTALNSSDAAQEAYTFVQYCTNRLWVFTDTGIRPSGEHTYGFSHRTFMEYFSAQAVLYRSATVGEVVDWLRLHARIDSGWSLVAELVIQGYCAGRSEGLEAIARELEARLQSREIQDCELVAFLLGASGYTELTCEAISVLGRCVETALSIAGTVPNGHGAERSLLKAMTAVLSADPSDLAIDAAAGTSLLQQRLYHSEHSDGSGVDAAPAHAALWSTVDSGQWPLPESSASEEQGVGWAIWVSGLCLDGSLQMTLEDGDVVFTAWHRAYATIDLCSAWISATRVEVFSCTGLRLGSPLASFLANELTGFRAESRAGIGVDVLDVLNRVAGVTAAHDPSGYMDGLTELSASAVDLMTYVDHAIELVRASGAEADSSANAWREAYNVLTQWPNLRDAILRSYSMTSLGIARSSDPTFGEGDSGWTVSFRGAIHWVRERSGDVG